MLVIFLWIFFNTVLRMGRRWRGEGKGGGGGGMYVCMYSIKYGDLESLKSLKNT